MESNIKADTVVTLAYTLIVDGEIIDQSEPGDPLVYLQGHSNIIPGLEKALEGKQLGEKLQVTISPEDGYGERDEENMAELDRSDFEDDIEIGATYYAQAEDGTMMPFTVVELHGDAVLVDFNPPLAGMTLHFDVEVLGVRPATEQELEDGHADIPEEALVDEMDGLPH